MSEQHEEQLTTADMAGATSRDVDVVEERETAGTSGAGRFSGEQTTGATSEQQRTPLFPSDEAQGFRSRWDTIQAGFVDEPRRAVEQADSLIAEVMKSLAASFADERQNLESQWDRGDDVSTEDLRIGLQRYRSFFDRLLSI